MSAAMIPANITNMATALVRLMERNMRSNPGFPGMRVMTGLEMASSFNARSTTEQHQSRKKGRDSRNSFRLSRPNLDSRFFSPAGVPAGPAWWNDYGFTPLISFQLASTRLTTAWGNGI